MTALTPPGAELELHVNVLRHGRRTCHARTPGLRGVRAAADVPEPPGVTGPVTTTWLELDGPAALRPARPPRVPGVAIAASGRPTAR